MRRLVSAVLLFLLSLLPLAAHAGVVTGVDGMTSTVLQKNQSSLAGLGMRARMHPEALIPQIELMPSFEYWRSSSSIEPYGIETMRKDATLAFDAVYRFKTSGWNPYAGMGYGLHFFTTRVNAPTLGFNNATDSVVLGGLSGIAGLDFGLTERIDNFIEMKYHHVSDHGQLKINWGLSYRL